MQKCSVLGCDLKHLAKGLCSRHYRHSIRRKDPHYHRDRSREIKAALVEYKGGCCTDCHGIFPNCCYHFDHRDPFAKAFHISGKMSWGLEYLIPEVDKCDLVCANCHAIRTYGSEEISRKLKKFRNGGDHGTA